MSRKDYELIANVLSTEVNQYDVITDAESIDALTEFSKALASKLATDNPRFDRKRFLAATA
jgi:hypothetical protein